MSREYMVNGVHVSETGTRSYMVNGIYISETVSVGPPPTGRAKVWTGSAWVLKPVKVWSGSAWAEKPMKVWNGSAWV